MVPQCGSCGGILSWEEVKEKKRMVHTGKCEMVMKKGRKEMLVRKRQGEERKEEKREKLRRKVEEREEKREVKIANEDEWMMGEVGNGLWGLEEEEEELEDLEMIRKRMVGSEKIEDSREEEERRRDQDREDDEEVRRILEGGCRFETLLGETQNGAEKVKVWMEKVKKGIDKEKEWVEDRLKEQELEVKAEEEERKKEEEEEEKTRKDEEERRKKEEEDKAKKDEEKRKDDEEQEKKRKHEEERRREEEEEKRKTQKKKVESVVVTREMSEAREDERIRQQERNITAYAEWRKFMDERRMKKEKEEKARRKKEEMEAKERKRKDQEAREQERKNEQKAREERKVREDERRRLWREAEKRKAEEEERKKREEEEEIRKMEEEAEKKRIQKEEEERRRQEEDVPPPPPMYFSRTEVQGLVDGTAYAYPYEDRKPVGEAVLKEVLVSEEVRMTGFVKFEELRAGVLSGVMQARVREDAWEVLERLESRTAEHTGWLRSRLTERMQELVREGRITYGKHKGGYKGVKAVNNQFIGYHGNLLRSFIRDWRELTVIPISCIRTALIMAERVFRISEKMG